MPSEKLALGFVFQILQICLLLLQHHADANETHDGLSLLGLACIADQWDLIRALLLHGACPSLSSTPPPQLPVQFLKTEHDRTEFHSQVSQFSGNPRPRRPCPCGSQRPLQDCHQVEPQPYPAEGICPCGAEKVHNRCCVRRTGMYWVEKWDPRVERLERAAVPIISTDPNLQKMGAALMLDIDVKERQEKLRAFLDDTHTILKDLGESGRIDPAYASAGCRVRFQPIFPSAVQTMSKVELNNAIRLWNEAVDVYVASKVDRRKPETIENAAKVGLAGGPLHRRCEAASCPSLEDRKGVKLLRCSRCNTTLYCSRLCQKSSWKDHKPVCESGEAKIQLLPSQVECMAAMNKMISKQLMACLPPGSDDALGTFKFFR
ncbi:hypothetical protein C8R44DRAFT_796262 [Mycena epipterygia]|nr:hypothetical protein C8R44DRAFT_796262 [Mycena epipterygia]